jgi:hypothetical protein
MLNAELGRQNMSMASIAQQVRANIAKLTKILRLLEEWEETQPAKRAVKVKRTVSASARRKMAAAQKARWARVRAGKAKR